MNCFGKHGSDPACWLCQDEGVCISNTTKEEAMLSTKLPEEDVMTAMLASIRRKLNEEADREINLRVSSFKTELTHQKNVMIAAMLDAIEVHVHQNPMGLNTEINIIIRPKYELRPR